MNNIVKFNKNIVKLLLLAMTVTTVGMLKPQTVNAEVAAVTVRLTPSATGGRQVLSNLFDAVPSFGGGDVGWKSGEYRFIKLNRGSKVTIAGNYYYKDLFGRLQMGYFIKEKVNVPTNSYYLELK